MYPHNFKSFITVYLTEKFFECKWSDICRNVRVSMLLIAIFIFDSF